MKEGESWPTGDRVRSGVCGVFDSHLEVADLLYSPTSTCIYILLVHISPNCEFRDDRISKYQCGYKGSSHYDGSTYPSDSTRPQLILGATRPIFPVSPPRSPGEYQYL